jgi:hypothetical protein
LVGAEAEAAALVAVVELVEVLADFILVVVAALEVLQALLEEMVTKAVEAVAVSCQE